jgi:hypothetical protein
MCLKFDCPIPIKLVWLISTCLNKICSKTRVGKHLSDAFPICNDSKQEVFASSPQRFNLASEYATRNAAQEIKRYLTDGEEQLVVSADDADLLGEKNIS